MLQIAEQVARELLADIPNVVLDNVDLVSLPEASILVVSIQSPRPPLPEGIARAEGRLRERSGDSRLRLLVRVIESSDWTSKGRVLFGESHFGVHSPEEAAMEARVEQGAKRLIEAGRPFIVTSIDAIPSDGGWAVRAATVGPRVPTPEDVRAIEKALRAQFGQSMALSIWASTDVVVSAQRFTSVEGARRLALRPSAPSPPR